MNRLLKVVGAALVFGGTVWAFVAFGDLAPGAPTWAAWLGPAAIVLGFPLLFRFGARHGSEVWDAGEWIEAGGTVRGVGSVEFGVRLRLRLAAPGHGAWNTETFIVDERQRELAERSKGAPVEALVRSNDRRVIQVLTVAGEAW
jgi:hypothetical protein